MLEVQTRLSIEDWAKRTLRFEAAMKHDITIEVATCPGDGLLSKIAQVLCARSLHTESFVWSALPDTDEARIWLIVLCEASALQQLASEFGEVTAVRRVIVHRPGQTILEALGSPPDAAP